MIALCPNHHAEADAGTIRDGRLYELKQNPHISEVIQHDFQFRSQRPRIELGDSVYCDLPEEGCKPVIRIRGQDVVSMQFINDVLHFNLGFYDWGNNLIGQVEKNDWSVERKGALDVNYKKKKLTVKAKDEMLSFGVHYRPDEDIIKVVGVFHYGNRVVVIDSDSVTIYRQPPLNPVEISGLSITGEQKPCIKVS